MQPSRGTKTCGRNALTNSGQVNSEKGKKSCIWTEAIPGNNSYLGGRPCKKKTCREDLGSLANNQGQPCWPQASSMPLPQRRAMRSWAALGVLLGGQRRGSFPSCLHREATLLLLCPSPGGPEQESHRCTGESPTEDCKVQWRTGMPLHWETQRAGAVQCGEEKACGNFISVLKF